MLPFLYFFLRGDAVGRSDFLVISLLFGSVQMLASKTRILDARLLFQFLALISPVSVV